jgi:hypothetical protein
LPQRIQERARTAYRLFKADPSHSGCSSSGSTQRCLFGRCE